MAFCNPRTGAITWGDSSEYNYAPLNFKSILLHETKTHIIGISIYQNIMIIDKRTGDVNMRDLRLRHHCIKIRSFNNSPIIILVTKDSYDFIYCYTFNVLTYTLDTNQLDLHATLKEELKLTGRGDTLKINGLKISKDRAPWIVETSIIVENKLVFLNPNPKEYTAPIFEIYDLNNSKRIKASHNKQYYLSANTKTNFGINFSGISRIFNFSYYDNRKMLESTNEVIYPSYSEIINQEMPTISEATDPIFII